MLLWRSYDSLAAFKIFTFVFCLLAFSSFIMMYLVVNFYCIILLVICATFWKGSLVIFIISLICWGNSQLLFLYILTEPFYLSFILLELPLHVCYAFIIKPLYLLYSFFVFLILFCFCVSFWVLSSSSSCILSLTSLTCN